MAGIRRKTTRLAGVKATEKKIQGYPVTRVDILDREGRPPGKTCGQLPHP